MFQAFVLAAGLGTRLRPLTDHRPKPLVPVCGVPLLAYSLQLCARHGLNRVVVNAHWLSEQIEAWAGLQETVNVTVSTEKPDVLGTGGGLRKVMRELDPVFAVLNGDVLHDVDLTALIGAVRPGGAAMALRPYPGEEQKYGIVAADDQNTVARLTSLARTEPEGTLHEDTHFTGIHAMDREALNLVPPDEFACIIRTAYVNLIPDRKVAGVRYPGAWLDAGDPAAYLGANLDVLSQRVGLALDPMPRAAYARRANGDIVGTRPQAIPDTVERQGPLWIGDGVEFQGSARLEESILGPGAKVPSGTSLTRTVVWDGCTVPPGDHVDAIVFPGGVLTPLG
ncbi:MAG: NDP-sugar synthase [Myxococcota bacterium]